MKVLDMFEISTHENTQAGIIRLKDGTYVSLLLTQSKAFRSRLAAENYLARHSTVIRRESKLGPIGLGEDDDE